MITNRTTQYARVILHSMPSGADVVNWLSRKVPRKLFSLLNHTFLSTHFLYLMDDRKKHDHARFFITGLFFCLSYFEISHTSASWNLKPYFHITWCEEIWPLLVYMKNTHEKKYCWNIAIAYNINLRINQRAMAQDFDRTKLLLVS